MISISSQMILRSIVLSVICATALGAFYAMILFISRSIIRIFTKNKIERKNKVKIGFGYNFIAFFLTLTFTLIYSVISYVTTDGVISIYSLIAAFVGFFCGKDALNAVLWKNKKKM